MGKRIANLFETVHPTQMNQYTRQCHDAIDIIIELEAEHNHSMEGDASDIYMR